MLLNHTTVTMALILVLGLTIAVIEVNNRNNTAMHGSATLVEAPKIGSVLSSGPWHQCINMDRYACAELIESLADSEKRLHIVYVPDGSEITDESIDERRVRIWYDESSDIVVDPAPRLG